MSCSSQETHCASLRRRLRRLTVPVVSAGAAVALAGCGSAGKPSQIGSSSKQTIVFAVQGGTSGGLGSEGKATADEIAAFEQAHPNIKVTVLPLSSTVGNSYQQVTQRFVAGSTTPDVIDSDSSWPAGFARAGWIASLDQFHPDKAGFLPRAVAATSYQSKMYGALWYFNVEGLYYRKDLVKTPPKTPQQLVAAAQAAMKQDPRLREGLAFEGSKYEGAVTAFIDFLGGFGGKLDVKHLDTPQNLQALQFLHDVVHRYRISPEAVTGWTEQNSQTAFTSGQSAFAVNWPFVLAIAEGKGSAVAGKTGFIPFPSNAGTPTATLASDTLIVNKRSEHYAADWELIKWLLRPDQQAKRAIASGDPPSTAAAYTPSLLRKAPFLKVDRQVFKSGVPRLVSANYQQVSTAIQDMISSVLANQQSPAAALKSTADRLRSLSNA